MENIESSPKKPEMPFVPLEVLDIKGATSRFYNVPDRSDVLIRKSFVNIDDVDAHKMTMSEKSSFLQNKIVEFRKMVEKDGIRVANTNFVIGTDPVAQRPVIYAVTDRIEGEILSRISEFDVEMANKIDYLYSKIIDSLIDSYLENGYFWYDPNNTQFILGKAEGDDKPDIYLIDLDPNVYKWDDPKVEELLKKSKEELFENRIDSIVRNIKNLERKVIDKDFKFTKSNQALERIKSEINY